MKYNIVYISLVVLTLASCAKVKVAAPDLVVTTASNTYKVGDTVWFQFQGNPDNITFYSGEPGHNYDNRNRTTADNDLKVDFRSFLSFGVLYQNLQVMVSNNYNGKGDTNSVKEATWVDITSQFTMSAGADQVPSGVVSLKPYVGTQPGSLVYVAFRYADQKKAEGQNRWVIRTFNADHVTPDGVVTNLATMATGGWKAVNFKNQSIGWTITTAQLLMYGGAAIQEDNIDWVISKGFDVITALPDAGVALKNISKTLESYPYVYTKPGTFKAVFDASAIRYNGEKSQLKELTLTINP